MVATKLASALPDGHDPRDTQMRHAVDVLEYTTQQQLAIRLQPQCPDGAIGCGHERRVGAAIARQARDIRMRLAADPGERAANDELAVGLRDRRDNLRDGIAVQDYGQRIRIVARVDGAIGIETRNPVARKSADLREQPDDHDALVGLHDNHVDRGIDRRRRKARVEAAVREYARDAIACLSADADKVASEQNAAVRLRRGCIHTRI